MAKKTKFTRAQIRSVRQAHKAKTPIKQIAKDHNLKYGQVTYILYTLRGIIQTKVSSKRIFSTTQRFLDLGFSNTWLQIMSWLFGTRAASVEIHESVTSLKLARTYVLWCGFFCKAQ